MSLFWRRRRFLTALTAIAFALSCLLFLMQPLYTATAELLVARQEGPRSALMAELGNILPLLGVSEAGKNPADYYARILRSRTIADSVIGKFGLQKVYGKRTLSETEEELAARSEILSTQYGSLRLSVEDNDPRRAAAIANEYVDQLRTVLAGLSTSEARYRRSFYEKQLEIAGTNLMNAELRLQASQQASGLLNPVLQTPLTVRAITQAKEAVAIKQAHLEAMRSIRTGRNPEVIRAERELRALRTQLGLLEREQGSDGTRVQPPATAMPEAQVEYTRRYRDVRYYETVYEGIARQEEAARLDESRGAPALQIVDRAAQPDVRSGPHLPLLVILITAFGFITGMVVICAQGLAGGS